MLFPHPSANPYGRHPCPDPQGLHSRLDLSVPVPGISRRVPGRGRNVRSHSFGHEAKIRPVPGIIDCPTRDDDLMGFVNCKPSVVDLNETIRIPHDETLSVGEIALRCGHRRPKWVAEFCLRTAPRPCSHRPVGRRPSRIPRRARGPARYRCPPNGTSLGRNASLPFAPSPRPVRAPRAPVSPRECAQAVSHAGEAHRADRLRAPGSVIRCRTLWTKRPARP